MKRFLRDSGVPAVLLAIKLLTALRTGIDTYAVSGDVINVLLLDGIFLALWLALAYGGDSQQMRRFRPFAVTGAWVMYLWMVVIGIEAHHSGVAVAVRVAGGMALAVDTYDWLAASVAGAVARRQQRRARAPDVYGYARQRFMGRLRRSVDRAARRLGGHMDVIVFEQIRADLPDMLRERFGGVVTVDTVQVDTAERSLDVQPVRPELTTEQRRERLLDMLNANPNMSKADLARALNVSRTTVYSDLASLDGDAN